MASWKIDKIVKWEFGVWFKYQNLKSEVFIKIIVDQLIIYSGVQTLESFSLRQKLKGFVKDGILVIVVEEKGNMRKLKMKFEASSNLELCLNTLRNHFQIVNMDSNGEFHSSEVDRTDKITEMITRMLQNSGRNGPIKDHLKLFGSEAHLMKDFIRCCIIDPSFPDIIEMVEKEMDSLITK